MALTKIPASLLDTTGGLDLQGNITLGDNEQIQLGDSGDLQIFHNGNNSIIQDNGDGHVQVLSGTFTVGNATLSKTSAVFNSGGSQDFYHNNQKKFETSSTGATVTGNLAVTGDLDITGNVNSASVTDLDVTDKTITLGAGQTEALSGGSGIIVDGSSASLLWDETNDEWDFNKSINVTGTITADNAEIGTGGASDANAFIDLTGDTTYTDFGFRILRNSGANGNTDLRHRGTGNITIEAVEAGNIVFETTDTERMRIDSSGNVNIGNGIAEEKRLIIDCSNPLLILKETDQAVDSKVWATQSIASKLYFRAMNDALSSATDVMILDRSGNVGIGTDSPQVKLQVNDTGTAASLSGYGTGFNVSRSDGLIGMTMGFTSANNSMYIQGRNFTNSDAQIIALNPLGGNVGIGNTSPSSLLSVGTVPTHTPGSVFTSSPSSFFSTTTLGGTTGNDQKITIFGGADASNVSGLALYRYRRATGTNWTTDGFSFRQEVDGSANLYNYMNFAAGFVGIGTPTPVEKLDVNGSVKVGNVKIQDSDGGRIGFNRNTADGAIYNSGYSAFQINGAYSGANFLDFQEYTSAGTFNGAMKFQDGKLAIGSGNGNFSGTPENAISIAHDGHGLGLDYVGATLPRTAGMYTSSTAHTATAYGDLNIKARTDYGNYYGIGFFTAPSNGNPQLRLKIDANGSVTINGAGTAGHSFEVQDKSDGYSTFWTGRSSSGVGRGLTASYGLMGVNSTQYDGDGSAYPIAGIGAAADNASHESVDFWFGSTTSEWQPMVFMCIGAHTAGGQTGQTAGWALIRATHYNNGISFAIMDSGGGGTWTTSVQGTFGADRANTSRCRITYSSSQNRTVLSVWGANYSGFYGAARA